MDMRLKNVRQFRVAGNHLAVIQLYPIDGNSETITVHMS